MKDNLVRNKAFAFAINIVKAFSILTQDKKEYVMSKQLLRSGTGVGAMIREAEQAESRADFIHKMAIALKEAKETDYWLDLLYETSYIDTHTNNNLKEDLEEVIRLLTTIIKTTKANQKTKKPANS